MPIVSMTVSVSPGESPPLNPTKNDNFSL